MHDLSRWTAFLISFACVLLISCTEQADGPTITLEHLGSSGPLPISDGNKLAVAGPDFVCLFDSYETELACGNLSWSDTLRFGRSGQGPGELGDYGILVSTSSGGVGFVDLPNDRISVFTRLGYARQLPLPQSFIPASDISRDGIYAGYASIPTQPAGGITLQEVDAENGEIVSEVRLKIERTELDEGPVIVSGATQLPNGDFVVGIAVERVQRLLRFSGDGTLVGRLKMPELPPRLPDAREIEIFKEGMARFPPSPAFDRLVREFAEKPVLRLSRNNLFRIVQMDPEGRVWVLTTDRSRSGTYVEAYSGLEYVGRAHLRGRVLAIQAVDSILVTLTEEMQTEEILPMQRLEWYGFGPGVPAGY